MRGPYWTVGSPIKFSDMKVEITGSPLLGEHTDEVLAELGYTPQQIARDARGQGGVTDDQPSQRLPRPGRSGAPGRRFASGPAEPDPRRLHGEPLRGAHEHSD